MSGPATAGLYTGRRVLVTGGAGFIGSHLVEALVADGASVVVIDDLSNGRLENLAEARGLVEASGSADLELHIGDITDRDLLAEACRDAEVVFHQAAIASVPRSVAEPVRYLHVNATGTLAVLLAARAAGVRRVVHAGSSSFYGDQPGFPRQETMSPDIRSPYAAAKAAGEFAARALAAGSGPDTATLRYFNIFGPRQRPDSPYAAVIPRFATAMLREEPLRLHGDGSQTRDFTFVGNAVLANLLAGRHPEPLGGAVFNVAAGERRTVRELIDRLEGLLGVRARVQAAPPRPGEVMHSGGSIARATEVLGYRPAHGFADGLEATVRWCRDWVRDDA